MTRLVLRGGCASEMSSLMWFRSGREAHLPNGILFGRRQLYTGDPSKELVWDSDQDARAVACCACGPASAQLECESR